MGELVSVITPAYNSSRFIADAIASVISQTYPNWEMVIVDDGSEDKTVEAVLAFDDPRIRCISHPVRLGAAEARNTALREAHGRWVAFLDSDDMWEPTKLERQLRFMEDNGYAFSYTPYLEMNADKCPTGRMVFGPKHIGKCGMYAYCWPGCLTVMYDTRLTGIVQTRNLDITDDYAIWLKVVSVTTCHLLNEPLARHRVVPGSLSDRSYSYKIGWHYRLFRQAEGMGVLTSVLFTAANICFGTIKKLFYIRRG
jgi:glycosyltransferase involved in cell wall biosynthesis